MPLNICPTKKIENTTSNHCSHH